MAEQAIVGFAGLLRQLRAEARLTQQELAKAAGVSPRSVSDLERGINRTARQDTAVRLAGALGLLDLLLAGAGVHRDDGLLAAEDVQHRIGLRVVRANAHAALRCYLT